MRLLISLTLSQYELACKYEIIWSRIAFSIPGVTIAN